MLDGSPAWDFQNRSGPENGDDLEIGIISGGASIDYATNRAYFASRRAVAESQNTLWCISFTGAQPKLEWARDIGNVDGSPILFNGVIYVGTVAGFVYAYDTSGTELWSNTTLSDGMAAVALLKTNPNPTRGEAREAMAGNLCRCGAYDHYLNGVMRAAVMEV